MVKDSEDRSCINCGFTLYEGQQIATTLRRTVYVTIVSKSNTAPPYHLREDCNARTNNTRIPTSERDALAAGLQVCRLCATSGVTRAELRNRSA